MPPGLRSLRQEQIAEWDFVIVKELDEGVTNSNTLQNDDELKFLAKAGDLWFIRLVLVYVSDATGDFKCDFAISTASWQWRSLSISTADAAVAGAFNEGAVATTTDLALGGGAAGVLRGALIEGQLRVDSDGTVTFRTAQNTTTAGQTATCKAGSQLFAKYIGNLT